MRQDKKTSADCNSGGEQEGKVRRRFEVEQEQTDEACVVKCPKCKKYTEIVLENKCAACGEPIVGDVAVVYGAVKMTRKLSQEPH